jgi:hypothetical protein
MPAAVKVKSNPMTFHRLLCVAVFAVLSTASASYATGQSVNSQQTILFGAAHYEEYPPYDRLDEDMRMMKRPVSPSYASQ